MAIPRKSEKLSVFQCVLANVPQNYNDNRQRHNRVMYFDKHPTITVSYIKLPASFFDGWQNIFSFIALFFNMTYIMMS
jgi:hypothetical protein